MKQFLDSANYGDIVECVMCGVIEGVTINQALLAKEPPCEPLMYFRRISDYLHHGQHLSVPLLDDETGYMYGLQMFAEIGYDKLAIKVPVSWRTLPIIHDLACAGQEVNATCIYSVQQADMAARAGATILSAFVGRMNDVQPDYGYRVLTAIKKRHPDLLVLAGSVRNIEMVGRVEECGADICTVSKTVLESLSDEIHSTQNAEAFNESYKAWLSQK